MKNPDSMPTFVTDINKQITRRNFLKSSGLVLISMGTFSCGEKSGLLEKASDFAPGVILGNPDLCGGCRRCEIICSAIKYPGSIRTESSLIKLDRKRFEGLFEKHAPLWAPDTCRQCKVTEEAPWCVKACPTGACHVDSKTKIRAINPELCIGCGTCVEACPYHMVTLDTLLPTLKAPEGRASKCDLCMGSPACVAECPSGALQFYVPWVSKIPCQSDIA